MVKGVTIDRRAGLKRPQCVPGLTPRFVRKVRVALDGGFLQRAFEDLLFWTKAVLGSVFSTLYIAARLTICRAKLVSPRLPIEINTQCIGECRIGGLPPI